MKKIKGAKSKLLWLIKDNHYYNYRKLIGCYYILINKTPAYEN